MTNRSAVTLVQVAARAGVSLKTASRALNGEPYVKNSTRELVREAAKHLGFHPNTAASQLARGETSRVVGLVIGDLSNPFYAAMASGVESELRKQGRWLALSSSDESPDLELAVVAEFARRQVNGLIVVSTLQTHESYRLLQERGIPVVFVDREATGVEADSVVLDNRGGSRMAAQRLLDGGHRRIGFLGDYERLPTFQERLAGFADALDGAEVEGWRELVREGAHDVDTARRVTAELLEHEAPTAIFASNNRAAIGATLAFASMTDAVPALIGFDDFDLAPVLGISVVSHDPVEMGRRAAQLVNGTRTGPHRTETMPTVLLERGSGERAPRA